VPEGTIPVAIGLVITGLSAYAFLSLTRYGLGTDASTPVNQLWFATFILAPGFFLPVEQEVGRALAHRRALGEGGQHHSNAAAQQKLLVTAARRESVKTMPEINQDLNQHPHQDQHRRNTSLGGVVQIDIV
jgi:hypothetical protein